MIFRRFQVFGRGLICGIWKVSFLEHEVDGTQSIESIWQKVKSFSADHLSQGIVDTWLVSCEPVSFEKGTLVLGVPNVFVKQQIENRFLEKLLPLLKSEGIVDFLELLVEEEVTSTEKERAKTAVATPVPKAPKNGLNPNYVFSSFVVGKSNRLAHAASLAVAESPGVAYNPLFIWGGVGLGKTHLMHAIGHYASEKLDNAQVLYISAEKFTNDLISSIRNNTTQEFRARYRNPGILLIDDIQFIGDKEGTQEEFHNTFNILHAANKQIVISSDRPPIDIKGVEERLVTRFAWGLVTDIQQPDIETRLAILQKKAEIRGYRIPEDVIYFLAQSIPSNIRELEGALNRVVACSELNQEPMNTENVSLWLKDIIRQGPKTPVSIDRIQQLVCECFGFAIEDLLSSKRTSDLSLARQIAMYLARKNTKESLQQIGYAFNKKDHTTVLYAYNKIEELLKANLRVKSIVDNVREKL